MPPRDDTLLVTEIFYSIQGESTRAGLPCVFVRLARCNLRCRWCDTEYSFKGGDRMTLDAVLAKVCGWDCGLVEITGGEPLAQKNCPALAARLLDAGKTVLVETGGSLPIDTLPPGVVRIMDLKCPDSGMCARNYWPNVDVLDPARDEVKFVIASRGDYEWSRDILRKYNLAARCRAVLMSPVRDAVPFDALAAWMLEDGLPARFQAQLHKIIWAPDRRGV